MTDQSTIALVDDHQILVYTLGLTFAAHDITCVGFPPAPAPVLFAQLVELGPALVLLDLDLGAHGDGIPLIRLLTRAELPVLVLTGTTDRVRLGLAVEQGAVAVVRKDAGFGMLLAAVRTALAGDVPDSVDDPTELLAALTASRDQQTARMRPYLTLTERERQVLSELANGRSVNEIAAAWVVSAATVRSHVQSVLTKLGVGSQLQAVVLAIRSGWLQS